MAKIVSIVIGLIAISASVWVAQCPCDRSPGAWVFGNVVDETVADWSFANDAALCQLEVSGFIPHSINLNCMADRSELFVSCARCDGKHWSTVAMEIPYGRIKILDSVYPVKMVRVLDDATLDRAWRARANKRRGRSTATSPPPRPSHWWSFRLESY